MKKSEYIDMEIIDDLNDENINNEKINEKINEKCNKKKENNYLKECYLENDVLEIGIDEVGRGPLFGRVYAAAVILPKDNTFDHYKMKDSKKFHSKKKIQEVADYIKSNAIAWSIKYIDEKTIDQINILQASQKAMHESILDVMDKSGQNNYNLLLDGNYFKPFECKKNVTYNFWCIEQGDNIYSSIAAASIIAKVERDKYIDDLCLENPILKSNYGIDTNKGYGAKKHIDGIKQFGITQWHRKTFGICKNYS